MIAWPESWPFFVLNGGQQCDMVEGPCACGAFHDITELYARFERAGITKPQSALWRNLTKRKRAAKLRQQDQTRLNCERFAREMLRSKLGHDPDDATLRATTARLVERFA